MLAKLEISEMRALQAIVAQKGITNAAQALNLSQSAVSHKIKRLETSLGRVLLNRQRGGGTLTEDGRQLYDYACRIVALHDEAVGRLARESLTGAIRLGVTEDMITSGLADLMGRFSRRYPELRLTTIVEQSRTMEVLLANAQLDIAVVQTFEDDALPTDIPLKRDDLVWIAPKDHDLSQRPDLPFVAFDRNCFYRHWLNQHGAALPRPLRVVMECSSVAGVIEAVKSGMGYALVSRSRLSDAVNLASEDLPETPRVVHVARYVDRSPDKAVRLLLKELTAGFPAGAD